MTDRIVMFSGGIGSWATAKRVAETYGTDGLQLWFADTKMEDEDLYRFLDEAAENVGAPLIKLALHDFRQRLEGGDTCETVEDGSGCACFTPDDYAPEDTP